MPVRSGRQAVMQALISTTCKYQGTTKTALTEAVEARLQHTGTYCGLNSEMQRKNASWLTQYRLQVFNSCISKMVCWVLWISPLGIASLISMSIVKACDLYQTLIGLGLWVVTVLLGLALFAGIILPCILWLITRTSPLQFLRTFSKALVMAFGTSSSSAALPVRFRTQNLN